MNASLPDRFHLTPPFYKPKLRPPDAHMKYLFIKRELPRAEIFKPRSLELSGPFRVQVTKKCSEFCSFSTICSVYRQIAANRYRFDATDARGSNQRGHPGVRNIRGTSNSRVPIEYPICCILLRIEYVPRASCASVFLQLRVAGRLSRR